MARSKYRFRKIDVRIWGDSKFRNLSSIPPCGQGLWFYLLANRHTTSIPGAYSIGEATIAEELNWPLKAFREAFREVLQEGIVKADFKAKLIFLPNAIKYNIPESPNVIIHWESHWNELPECELKCEIYEILKSFIGDLSPSYIKAFNKAIRKPSLKAMSNQEQEQEQEQEQRSTSCTSSTEPSQNENSVQANDPCVLEIPCVGKGKKMFELRRSQYDFFLSAYPGIDLNHELSALQAWNVANPTRRKTHAGMLRHINAWLSKAQNNLKTNGGNYGAQERSARRKSYSQQTREAIAELEQRLARADDEKRVSQSALVPSIERDAEK
ncbi:MAG: hypothetical protein A3E87_01745 [Gammaproteobacteria bacterium RIFCSPHIGHO2_12_FULL_35_23]|nr:MAG: hypothetical protein A3E87_01745 [Gammaproteobacteria bacterium RIFCSPHIGHO2_12_FULL_35_23]